MTAHAPGPRAGRDVWPRRPVWLPVWRSAARAVRRAVHASRRDEGSVTLFVVVLVFAVLAVAGLVLDGGAQLTAQRRGDNQAEQAARAGAQAVDQAGLRDGTGTARLLEATATAGATAYLRASGYPDATITVRGSTVAVSLTQTAPTRVLGMLGIPTLTVHAHGSAQLLPGVLEATP